MNGKIRKKIVVDENNKPLEIIIDYRDWEKIERLISTPVHEATAGDLGRYNGVLKLRKDPLVYQKRIRDEWK